MILGEVKIGSVPESLLSELLWNAWMCEAHSHESTGDGSVSADKASII